MKNPIILIIPFAPAAAGAGKAAAGKAFGQIAASQGISAGSSFFSDLFFGNRNYKRQRKAEERAWQRTLELRDYENKYNSPQEQMKRLMEAGLNPHLMYGQGTQAQPASRQSTSGGQIQNSQFKGMNVDPLAAMAQIQSINNMKAQEDKTNAETQRLLDLTPLDKEIKANISNKGKIDLQYMGQEYEKKLKKLDTEIGYTEKKTGLLEEEAKILAQKATNLGIEEGILKTKKEQEEARTWLYNTLKSMGTTIQNIPAFLQYAMDVWQGGGHRKIILDD